MNFLVFFTNPSSLTFRRSNQTRRKRKSRTAPLIPQSLLTHKSSIST